MDPAGPHPPGGPVGGGMGAPRYGWPARDPAVPDAPWALVGECMVAVVSGRARGHNRGRAELPLGVSRLPGPALVVAMRYTDSPVGPFLELAVAEPARL